MLDAVTSLFDLEQKAKINAYYKQVAMLGVAILSLEPLSKYVGKKISDETFRQGMRWLENYVKDGGNRSCRRVVQSVNNCISYVKEEVVETPTKTRVRKYNSLSEYSSYDYMSNCYTNYKKTPWVWNEED